MDLALNNLQWLICLKTQTTNPSGTWLVASEFVLMQNNDPKHTSKLYQSKEE